MSAGSGFGEAQDSGRRVLSIFAPVPIAYEGRDFILHVFGLACRAVLTSPPSGAPATAGDPPPLAEMADRVAAASLERLWRIVTPFAAGLALTGILLVAAPVVTVLFTVEPTMTAGGGQGASAPPRSPSLSLLQRLATAVKPETLLPWGITFLTVGVVSCLHALRQVHRSRTVSTDGGSVRPALLHRLRRLLGRTTSAHPPLDPRMQAARDLERHAARALDEIRYQRSYTAGWSGAFKMPVALETGMNLASTLAETQRTLPEIVRGYREFMALATTVYDRVVVAIDELDKLESEEVVFRFLNELKALFGIDGCFYLISVSDGALRDFERRSLSLSNVFDSAFDTVLRADYLNIVEARALIRKRVARLPQSFLGVLYLMSGGLPRDLIRVTRDLGSLGQGRPERPDGLPALVQTLVINDVRAKVFATRMAINTLEAGTEGPDLAFLQCLEPLQAALHTSNLTSSSLIVDAYQPLTTLLRKLRPAPDTEDSATRQRLRSRMRELAGYLYFAGTLLELFCELASEHAMGEWAEALVFQELARAQQELRMQPEAAVVALSRLREKMSLMVPSA